MIPRRAGHVERPAAMVPVRPLPRDALEARGLSSPPLRSVALLGNHLPRQCGIATFTTHLADALPEMLRAGAALELEMDDAGCR
jgi:hypothetical protein